MREQFKYELRKESNDTYALVIFLENDTEFANELGSKPEKRSDILTRAKQIVKEKYPNVKVTMLKVIAGGLVLTAIPLTAGQSTAEAHSTTTESAGVYHHVQPGDTLWDLSNRYNVTVDEIKQANHLTSDLLKVDQDLIIPKTVHTVAAGDYLSVLAKKYGTTVEAIKEANGLSSDTVKIGQTLVIPSQGGSESAVAPTQQNTETETASTYTVAPGDSLSVIAKRFGTTVNALKATNNLTSDFLRVGQDLTIPTSSATVTTHTVVSGDNLWDIAKKYGTTVNALKSTNQLTSELLQVGQLLTIPTTGATETTNTVTSQRQAVEYTVVSGDNLTFIAKKYGVTIDAIRQANNLSTDVLQIGQTLTIPNGVKQVAETTASTVQQNSITYTTHTVASGDNIWDLSVRYGIPQYELLRANNLTTSSMLSIGQKLKVPVHNIAVKDVVSERHGEYLDWFTEAQYVFPIGKTAKVTDFATGKSFYIKRTIGANHADSETVSVNDTNIAKSVWGGFSWTARAVIVEVDGRNIAASMTFMPHDIEFIKGNGITGHFDVYFGDSIRHKDGKPDLYHQKQVEIASGIQGF